MKSTYLDDDVRLLYTDIETRVVPMSLEAREQHIRRGFKACELLAEETVPTDLDINIYECAMKIYQKKVADAVQKIAECIYDKKKNDIVLVSLARAGISIGVLIKRYLDTKYMLNIPHYGMSIVGTNGVDVNALKYILSRHDAGSLQFIDGWTGKGFVQKKLKEGLLFYPQIDSKIAVLCDPGGITCLAGTHEDILVPSATLNSVVSGLLSRSVDNSKFIKNDEFFGAVCFSKMIDSDRTYDFIERISSCFDYSKNYYIHDDHIDNMHSTIESLIREYHLDNTGQIKPGLCETFRSINRKKPSFVLVSDLIDKELLNMIKVLGIQTIQCQNLGSFKICGIYTDKYSDT